MLVDNHLRMDGGEYRSPLCKVIQVNSQGVICASGDNIADDEDNRGTAPGFRWDD